MEALPGFVSLPRLAGSLRPAGAFFSAVVETSVGPNAWRIRLDGQAYVVSTDLPLIPGQTLRLRSAGVRAGQWILQILTDRPGSTPSVEKGAPWTPLMTAFLSRGLPLTAERLAPWARWLTTGANPSDKDSWAASLEARGTQPHGPWAERLEPWLTWQASLEAGDSRPPPNDEAFWDLWNLRQPSGGEAWIVLPLRWDFDGTEDSGLLQARWNSPAQRFDRWRLTAAPAGVPFRLDASFSASTLDLVWRFFRPEDQALWGDAAGWGEVLTTPQLTVTLRVCGPEHPLQSSPGSIDVQA